MEPKINIPQSCPLGLTQDDLKSLPGRDISSFWRWFRGRTVRVCTGQSFNYVLDVYEDTSCAGHPHGPVVHPIDVKAYLEERPVLD